MKKLPIGIQTFREIIEEGYVYVDKTPFAHRLITQGKYYLLSRPRRFGKSLFLDTLSEIFKGNRYLFKGLFIHDRHDFRPHPVIHISFGSGDYSDIESIEKEITYLLKRNQKRLGVSCDDHEDAKLWFRDLIEATFERHNEKVVILIDEYDKPILDNILDSERATYARDLLKNLYSVIKDSDQFLRFVFITGVSKFSKLSLFSGLNNLEDISVDKNYAEICGYTQQDLDTVFSEHLKGADMGKVRLWYNGYNYFGQKLYNPFDILLFISESFEFKNYWWSTGNPSFLIETLKAENYYIPELEGAEITEEALDAFDVDYIDVLALFWQTGYLTFKEKIVDEFGASTYRLTIPNLEIRLSLNNLLIDYLTRQRHEKLRFRRSLDSALSKNDFEAFINTLKSIFSSIPYHNYANNIISQYEGYYSSVVFVYLSAIGYDVIPEDTTNRGRIDLTMRLPDKTLIIEFKVDSQEPPVNQALRRGYAEKYMADGKPIFIIGIKFDSQRRKLTEWEVRKID